MYYRRFLHQSSLLLKTDLKNSSIISIVYNLFINLIEFTHIKNIIYQIIKKNSIMNFIKFKKNWLNIIQNLKFKKCSKSTPSMVLLFLTFSKGSVTKKK